jgi:hypothetical protein
VHSERESNEGEKAEVLLARARLRYAKELGDLDKKLFKAFKVTEKDVSAALKYYAVNSRVCVTYYLSMCSSPSK